MKRNNFITNATKMWLAALCLVTYGLLPAPISADSAKWTFTQIDVPDATNTIANDINDSGDIVGIFRSKDGFYHGFLSSKGEFTTIDFPLATRTYAQGINSRGDIVGQYLDSAGVHGFLLQDGVFRIIEFPDSTGTEAWGVNSRGDITGDYFDSKEMKTKPFLLTKDGDYISLDPPFPFASSLTHGVSQQSDLIVGCWFDGAGMMHSLIINNGEYLDNDFPDSRMSMNWRVNSSGQMVGHYVDNAGKTRGYLYSKGNHSSIEFPGPATIYTEARGINASGEIVGLFYNNDRLRHGFLLSKK